MARGGGCALRGYWTTATLIAALIGVSCAGYVLSNGIDVGATFSGPFVDFLVQAMATVVGAVIATAVSYHLAFATKREAERASVYSLITKVSLMTNDIFGVVQHIDDSLIFANDQKNTGLDMWQRIQPLIGLGDPITIEPEELAPMFAAGETNLVNDLIQLQMRHHSTLATMKAYGDLRLALQAKMPIDEVNGGMVSAAIPAADLPRFKADAMALEKVIRDFSSAAREHLTAAFDVGSRVGPAARRMFSDQRFPRLARPEEVEALRKKAGT